MECKTIRQRESPSMWDLHNHRDSSQQNCNHSIGNQSMTKSVHGAASKCWISFPRWRKGSFIQKTWRQYRIQRLLGNRRNPEVESFRLYWEVLEVKKWFNILDSSRIQSVLMVAQLAKKVFFHEEGSWFKLRSNTYICSVFKPGLESVKWSPEWTLKIVGS